MNDFREDDPVAFFGILTAAVLATDAFLGYVFGWSEELLGAVDLLIVGWLAVGVWWVRRKVMTQKKGA